MLFLRNRVHCLKLVNSEIVEIVFVFELCVGHEKHFGQGGAGGV